jgi:hypothetical protein
VPETKNSYLCDGFYPICADKLMHAGLLFALQIARRRHGPKARCTKLDLAGALESDGATFEPSSERWPALKHVGSKCWLNPDALARGVIRPAQAGWRYFRMLYRNSHRSFLDHKNYLY